MDPCVFATVGLLFNPFSHALCSFDIDVLVIIEFDLWFSCFGLWPGSVWAHTLSLLIDEDIALLALGFSVLLLTARQLSIQLLSHYLLNISFFISGLYVLAPICYTLTKSISSDSIVALTVSLLIILFWFHDKTYWCSKNPNLASNISLNASIVASVLVASRLPSRLHVFTIMLFSLQVFLFAPLITFCIKKYSNKLRHSPVPHRLQPDEHTKEKYYEKKLSEHIFHEEA
ncbi:hypothetical protein ZIOFF_024855 [Zingiber officinale]|uniref:Phosphatidylinositol N-acetylglucosaminyltransferase subunit C n=1 Tax=Zingiber officinale TaxID=94328 RepID=A0A8J5GUY9_ZINOF|nr:hypothetical protein ZIOFF_024855 [Zingiber officinale]